MFDFEFQKSQQDVSGLVLYRYRTGYLRHAMLAAVQAQAKRSERVVDTLCADELKDRWLGEGLFPAIKVCDLPPPVEAQHLFRRLKPLFSLSPGEPTLILMRASHYNRGQHVGATVIDEPIVTERNMADILDYLAPISGFKHVNEICVDKTFQAYFRHWIKYEEQVSLPELAKELDRFILLYWNPETREFSPPDVVAPDPANYSFLVRALGRFLDSPAAGERSMLLRAISTKKGRGLSDLGLAEDLMRASLKVLKERCAGITEAGASIKASGEAAILWGTLLIAWSARIAPQGTKIVDLPGRPALIAIEHLLRKYAKCLEQLGDDPIEGYWNEFLDAVAGLEESESHEESNPKRELSDALFAESAKRRHMRWLEKLASKAPERKLARRPIKDFVYVDPNSDLISFDEVVGQPHIVDEIRRRIADDRHDQPLLLAGPTGSGKRSIARLYAKRLLCEGASAESIDPCGDCVPCGAFASSSLWGYLEFDLARANILEGARYHIDQLRYEPVSERRVVLLKDPDRSDEATDAFLKTLEKGVRATTFVILTQDERAVRAAALSRSDRFLARKMERADAGGLIGRWLPAARSEGWLVDIIALHGLGRPGLMWHLSQMVVKSSAWTIDTVLTLFDLHWGARTVDYLSACFNHRDEVAEELLLQIDTDPKRVASHVRSVLHQLIAIDKISEASLVGQEQRLQELSMALDRNAEAHGLTSEILWANLARHWLRDTIVDTASLVEAGREAQRTIRDLGSL